MKRLIALWALLCFVFVYHPPVEAANAATAQTPLLMQIGGRAVPVTPVVVTFDTTAQDLTIFTPASGKMACVVGLNFSEGTAANLTVKSGSTTLVTWELATNQGVLSPIGNHAIFCGAVGEAIKFNVSAVISTMLVYVAEADRFNFSGN